MDVMNNLETFAVVGEEMSYFRRAETSKASSCIEGLTVALSERLYHVLLIKLSEKVCPRLNLVDGISVQVAHGLALHQHGQFSCYLVNAFSFSSFVAIVIFCLNF